MCNIDQPSNTCLKGPTIVIKMWSTLSYNTCVSSVFVEETLDSINVYPEHWTVICTSRILLNSFYCKEEAVLFQQGNAAYIIAKLFIILFKMFNETWWKDNWPIQFTHLQVLLYLFQQMYNHGIMHCRMIFTFWESTML